jgi:osmoprotectant transport system permease protein
MELIGEVANWLTDPANWSGRDGIPVRVLEHVLMSGVALVVGLAIALPLGLFIGHTRRWTGAVVAITNIGRAVPSIGILGIVFTLTLPLVAALDLRNIGTPATVIALIALAIPPIVVNTYTGIRDVDVDVVEAARGMGMSGRQVLRRVEVPLALAVILAGVRTASVQVIATATLGAVLSSGGLGRYIVDGFAQRDEPQMVSGALLVMLLAMLSEGLFALAQRRAVSPGIRSDHLSPTDPIKEPAAGFGL